MNRKILAVIFCAVVAQWSLPAFGQAAGESTYKGKCAMCHGADGLASTPMAKAMKVPSARSAEFKALSETEMITATKNGKGKMPAYKDKLSDGQIHEVVVYMRSLEKK